MARYSAGTLEFKIIGTSDASTQSLQRVVDKLNLMNTTLSSVMRNFGGLQSSIKGMTSTDLKWISSLSARLTNLNSKDLTKATSNFLSLTNAITPFIDKVRSAQDALVALSKVMDKTNTMSVINTALDSTAKKTSATSIKSTSLGKALNFGWALGKIYFIFNYTKRFAQMGTNMVQKAIDYTETLNMWQVAMRNNIDMADEFISKMNRAYGISEQNLMKYQATFKNMFSALGQINEEISYGLSEAITQMAIDYSSLYNVKMEQAMTTFRAMMAGQVRPIRSISGYDITENTIFQLYQDIGGTKTMRQLSQVEKRLLRIFATYKQMGASGAVGDMSKTIEQMANQLRIMNELGTELGQWIGMLLKGLIESSKVLVYINAGLIVARRIVQSMAVFFGYETPDFLTDLVTIVEKGNEELDKMTGKLLSFDRFEALNKADTGDATGMIDEAVLNAISQYRSILADTEFEAQGIADSWLKTLGFQYNATTQLWEYEDGMETIVEKIKQAGTGVLGWSSVFMAVKHPFSILLVSFAYLYATSEDVRESVTGIGEQLGKWKIGQKMWADLTLIVGTLTKIMEWVANALNWTLNFLFGGVELEDDSGYDNVGDKIMSDIVSAMAVGALVGLKFKSGTGFIITAGLVLAMNSYKAIFNDDGDIVYNKIMSYIASGLIGAGIGAKFGGVTGALIGLTVGVTLALAINAIKDVIMSKNKEAILIDFLGLLIGGLGGAAMGWYLATSMAALGASAGPVGALLGFAVGVALSFFIQQIDWSNFNPTYNQALSNVEKMKLGIDLDAVYAPNSSDSSTYIKKKKVIPYASGGFIEDGIFTMNKGELAGNFFDGTPVAANNMQIISGIRAGVYEGVSKAMQNSNKGGGDVYIDGTKVGKVIENKVYAEGQRVGHFGR
jgi:uncharacterized protein YqgV (UPF0045/DUF77 family)